jgi:hypothetical protein
MRNCRGRNAGFARARDSCRLRVRLCGAAAVEEDFAMGVLQRRDPRNHCLCYRFDSQPAAAASADAAQVAAVPAKGKHQKGAALIWETASRYLGASNSKVIATGKQDADVDGAAERAYLEKLSSEFVADVKAMIARGAAKVQQQTGQSRSVARVVREVQHHVGLQTKKLLHSSPTMEIDNNDLLKRIQAFVRDPHKSNKPFVLHGAAGSGKSTAMAAIGSALLDWFSREGAVVALRFLGTSSDASDVHSTVSSVASQIRLAYGVPQPPASVLSSCDTLHGELVAFRQLLDQVSRSFAHTKPLFILLDGIDHLYPSHDALEALWAIRRLPPNVYMFLSTISTGNRASDGAANGPRPDVLGALLALVTDEEMTFELRVAAAEASRFSSLDVPFLMELLDSLELEYGRNIVTLFCAYVSVTHVGITDAELCDLLPTHGDFAAELGTSLNGRFVAAIVSELRHRLGDFLEDRLVNGVLSFGWSRGEHRGAVAARYGLIVNDAGIGGGPGRGEHVEDLSTEATNFTLMLHERIANEHLKRPLRSSLFVEQTSSDSAADGEDDDDDWHRATTIDLNAENPLSLSRLWHHLRVLLPLEGLDHVGRCTLFNFPWLAARVASAPVHVVLNDVISVYRLASDMLRLSIIEDSVADVMALFECLQTAKKAIGADPRNLAVELVTRLGRAAASSTCVDVLVGEANRWLAETNFTTFVPSWPVWKRPGDALRHCMDGFSHTVGFVEGAEVAVTYGQKNGIGVWRLQTGSMLHRFDIRSEQSLDGVVSAHDSTYVITMFYSHIERRTELSVLNTETGIELFNMKFPREFETIALSDDDQLAAISSVDPTGSDGVPRLILGIQVLSRDVVFRLPVVGGVHPDGITRLLFVKNIRRESESILSVGTKSSHDIALWDLDNSALDYRVDLGCAVDIFRLAVEQKMAIGVDAESGALVVVNLARGSVEQTLRADEYRGATDAVVYGHNVFVAARTGVIVIVSIAQNAIVGHFQGGGQSVPSKLTIGSVNETALLFVGHDDGDIRMFDIAAESLVGRLSDGHKRRINSLDVLPGGRLVSSSVMIIRTILWMFEKSLETGDGQVSANVDERRDEVTNYGTWNVFCETSRTSTVSRSAATRSS